MTEQLESILILFFSAIAAGSFVLLFPNLLKPYLKMLLAFSGAFLLGIAVLHILPEAYHVGGERVGLFIIAGFLLQILLEYYSGGIEHGHVHAEHAAHGHVQTVSWTMLLSLFIHAFTESMPLGFHDHDHAGHAHAHTHNHAQSGYLWAIVIHKVPITIALVGMMVGLSASRAKTITYLVIFALAAPLGILIHPLLEKAADPSTLFAGIMGLAAGIILHVSTTILLEASENHRFNLYKMGVIVVGFVLAFMAS
jgi:zinc and cadmium transporter